MDFDKKSKPKVLSCMQRGPGPRYKLKSLTGYEDHDPSRRRSPAFSMKFRPKTKLQCTGPGPYSITHHMTNRGLEVPAAYSMAFRPHKKYEDSVPGPGAYAPEKYPPVNHHRRAAAYTILFRHDKTHCKDGPGPIYMLPTCIGPEIPDVKAEGAYSMAFKHKQRIQSTGPGPAAYSIKLNPVKKQYPAYSMKFRHNLYDYSRQLPGPQYSYNIDLIKKRQPMYSFGVRHSECTAVGLTENDEI
ncbi:outer dense fiber protein 3-like isoform X1 [Nasonia vitripennis]|uniref:Outer dense fiber protein 3-like protein 2 n=1 Tax=Nasonia vitripennis TaxID=7425 RepID=A0A7M7LRF1_NASVI|nr:outer dense fiber protein 3-like isoform X1 [Nasonia vitripennis]